MKGNLCLLLACIISFSVHAQEMFSTVPIYDGSYTVPFARKLYQQNYGIILGLQRGKTTAIEMGGEAHWRKLAISNPHIIGATANMEYNFADNVIGYKAGVWRKQGRINFTYGANVSYFSNFKGLHKYGIGPSVGFRLAGFHLINGYNFLAGDKELKQVNTLYITLRYYFPVQNKFTWDRKTMKRKRDLRRERERRKEQRQKEIESGERKGIWKWLPFDKPKMKSGTSDE